MMDLSGPTAKRARHTQEPGHPHAFVLAGTVKGQAVEQPVSDLKQLMQQVEQLLLLLWRSGTCLSVTDHAACLGYKLAGHVEGISHMAATCSFAKAICRNLLCLAGTCCRHMLLHKIMHSSGCVRQSSAWSHSHSTTSAMSLAGPI